MDRWKGVIHVLISATPTRFFQFNGFIACVTGYCVAYKQVFPGKKLSFKGLTIDCRVRPLEKEGLVGISS